MNKHELLKKLIYGKYYEIIFNQDSSLKHSIKGIILLMLNTKFHILTEHGLLIIDSADIKQIEPIIFIEEESMPKEFIEYYHLCNKE